VVHACGLGLFQAAWSAGPGERRVFLTEDFEVAGEDGHPLPFSFVCSLPCEMPCYARQACLPARQAVGQKSISQHAQWCTTIARTHIRLKHDPLATSFDVSLLLNQSSTLCGRQAAPTNRGLRKNLLATGLIRSIRPQGDRCLKKHRGNRANSCSRNVRTVLFRSFAVICLRYF
jgi:hypothetical protein